MEIGKMEIRVVPVELLNPAKYNPRKDLTPEDEDYKKLENSLSEFGYADPIIWNETTGNIVGGHQRLKILINKGVSEVMVSVVHMQEAQEKAFNIALNKISGSWDDEKLRELLADIEANVDMGAIGFDKEEFESLVNAESNNFINELLNDDFISISYDKKYFAVTFTFQSELKERFDRYFKENGKALLTEKIVNWIKEGNECRDAVAR